MAAYKLVTQEYDVASAITEALTELEALCEEVTSWRDGMEGTNLENSSKYEILNDAVYALEQVDTIDTFDMVTADIAFKVSLQVPTQKRYTPSRTARLGNAVALLLGAAGAIDNYLSVLDEADDAYEDLKSLAEEVRNAADTVEGVEFPGFYG